MQAITKIVGTVVLGSAAVVGVSSAAFADSTYTVQSGDTLSAISQHVYGDSNDFMSLAKANSLGDPNKIYVGQVITVPSSSGTSQEASQSAQAPSNPINTSSQVPSDNSSVDWSSVAQCESTGNWSIDTGNGFYGGLQFTESTWLAYGGGQYAQYANQAGESQQIAVAENVLAGQGIGAWPVCGSKG
jgi:LysM repeat protein